MGRPELLPHQICEYCEYANRIKQNDQCLRKFKNNEILPVKDHTKPCAFWLAGHAYLTAKYRGDTV